MTTTAKITLNGKTFAAGAKAMQEGDTGFYRLNKTSISLFDRAGTKVGVITKHRVLACATLVKGKWWYSYADIPCIGRYESLRQEMHEIETALSLLPGNSKKLAEARAMVAEDHYQDFDFGGMRVTSCGSWETEGDHWTKPVYLQNPDGGDSIKGHIEINFFPNSATIQFASSN